MSYYVIEGMPETKPAMMGTLDWIKVYDDLAEPSLCDQLIAIFDDAQAHKQTMALYDIHRRCQMFTTLDSLTIYDQVKNSGVCKRHRGA